ncbi:structural cement protein Gp24 [Coralloluteibacterium thermophilus]|uniref:DUF2190 family protein n=1 Tax=Coralloluteibacterium thermophilum TaxID=2707049 RepID=A0ABV9NMM9_9GAMM
MALQTDYNETQPAAIAGAQATMIPATIISRNVEGAPIGFGVAVSQGAADKGIVAGGAEFVGITLLDRSAAGENDTFRVGDSARVLTKGDIWVVAAGAVNAGDAVAVGSNGAFSAAGEEDTAIPGARWDTSTTAAGQLAVIRLG